MSCASRKQTVREVSAAEVSVKRTNRFTVSTSDKLKLAKSTQEEGENKFILLRLVIN